MTQENKDSHFHKATGGMLSSALVALAWLVVICDHIHTQSKVGEHFLQYDQHINFAVVAVCYNI